MIVMENVCKTYKAAKRNAGLKEACKSLLHRETEEIKALSDVSFTIRDGELVGYIFGLPEVQRAVRHMEITHINQANRGKELKKYSGNRLLR